MTCLEDRNTGSVFLLALYLTITLCMFIHCPILSVLCVMYVYCDSYDNFVVLLFLPCDLPSLSALRLKSWRTRLRSPTQSSTTGLGRLWQLDSEWGRGGWQWVVRTVMW